LFSHKFIEIFHQHSIEATGVCEIKHPSHPKPGEPEPKR